MEKSNSLRGVKNEFREKYKRLRLALPAAQKEAFDEKIAGNVMETLVYKHCTQILCYASTGAEISTRRIWEKALADGKKVLFPKCFGDHHMKFYYIRQPEDLQPGKYGLEEPVSQDVYVPDISDICIVPAFSYDKYGYRLGYGKGYYDRFLSGFTGARVGLCYSGFVEPQLPRGRYDVKVDVLITEKGIFSLHK